MVNPVFKYGPYNVDSYEKYFDTNFCVGDRKSVFQFKMSAILEKVIHIEKLFFAITLQQIVILTQTFNFFFLFFNYLIGLFKVQ